MDKVSFELWWYNEGSGISVDSDHDYEEHAKKIAKIAWEIGYMEGFSECLEAI